MQTLQYAMLGFVRPHMGVTWQLCRHTSMGWPAAAHKLQPVPMHHHTLPSTGTCRLVSWLSPPSLILCSTHWSLSVLLCSAAAQCSEFVDNTINTGWLDQRIAANVKMEQPPWHLCVIGAAAVRAHEAFACKAAEYLGFLSKGQLPPADISLIFFQVGTGVSGVGQVGAQDSGCARWQCAS